MSTTILDELKEFTKNMLQAVYLFLGLTILFFSFGLKTTTIFGRDYFLPLPSGNSFSVQVFDKIQHDLLPAGVRLIVTNPLSGFVSQVVISFLLAFALSFPFFLYKIMQYVSPALFEHERRAMVKSLLPFSLLFFAGCLLSYFFIIPLTFKLLYPYATAIGATTFFSVDEFIGSIVSLMLTTGIMFLMPLCMVLLSFLKVVQPSFWISKWRYALLSFLIFSAIITPDGTGITMAMLFFPLIGLYFAGCLFSKRISGRSSV